MTIDVSQWLQSGVICSLEKGKLLIAYGERVWSAKPKKEGLSFFFPDFFLSMDKPWFSQSKTVECSPEVLMKALNVHLETPIQSKWQLQGKELFFCEFDRLKSLFSSRTLRKAVPYIVASCPQVMGSGQIVRSLLALLGYSLEKEVYLYGFWDELAGILGASPELLLRINENLLETSACAGTAASEKAINEVFDNDAKLKVEHQWVIEGISSSLRPFGAVSVGKTAAVEFASLSHMLTPITVVLEGRPPIEDLIQALHPTPALGAYPKKEGEQWLAGYGACLPRGRYGAPVGFVETSGSEIKATFYVAIRNMQWDPNGIAIGAGCGVVETSAKEAEWEEVKLKLRAIEEMLSLETALFPTDS